MTISSIQTVIDMNQQTIDHLEAQDYYRAVASASSALQHLGNITATQQDRFLQASTSPASSFDQCILLTRIAENDDTPHQDDSPPFIYSDAIPLAPTVTNYAIVAPVLMFNAALAHHLIAKQDKERSIQYLYRAKQLYTLAYNSQDIQQNPLFQFVLYNNTALIDLQIGNTESWNASIFYLLSIYMILVDQGRSSHLRHIRGFLRNLPVATPTAPAA
ncbi:unnamed protein product [Cylindrotheca closterium]|uniref:Uncharacterized protein n=1 Tax=Cylindrotheca closterium TaxID=2856 RepID=A0AAD2G7F4_9STRA|nr:unnamed protein product [Cylindrotheca closterium]